MSSSTLRGKISEAAKSAGKKASVATGDYAKAIAENRKAGQQVLRDVAVNKTDLEKPKQDFIGIIARTKFGGLSQENAMRLATRDFERMATVVAERLNSENPNLEGEALQAAAEQEILSGKYTLKDFLAFSPGLAATSLAEKGKELAKEEIKKRGKAFLVKRAAAFIPVVGQILAVLLFLLEFKIVKRGLSIVLALLLFCCCCMCCVFISEVNQIVTELKSGSLTSSAALIHCAGEADPAKTSICLVNQKSKEYAESDPQTEI